MSTSVASASSRSPSGRLSLTPTPSLGDRTTPSSLSSLLRPTTADTREQGMHIRHGILPTYTISLSEPIHNILFQSSDQQSLVLSRGQVCSMYTRGKRKEKHSLTEGERDERESRDNVTNAREEVVKLLYASEHNVYVGICKNMIKLFNARFECYWEVSTDKEIISAVYNDCSGEVVTGSHQSITVWTFRQGGKKITPSQVIEEGLQGPGGGNVTVLHMEDVLGRAQRCFAAVTCGIKVYQLCNGHLLSSRSSLHHCLLTTIFFFRPLRLLISADCDGAIKVWDSNWRLCCTFIGHREAVTSLTPYPYGPLIISGSLDSTLRVWDLTSHDQVDCIDSGAPVLDVHSTPGTPHILTHSHSLVKGWRVQQLYKRSAVIGRQIQSLIATTHPLVPTRLLVTCKDSAIRLVCPVGGHVITTALLPTDKHITSVVYFPLTELMYVLEEEGTVTVFNTCHSPCSITDHWTTAPNTTSHFTCLAHYEYTMDEDSIEEMLCGDRWLGVVLEARKLSRLAQLTKDPLTEQREGMSLLLAGTNEGHIALVDHTTGAVTFSLKVHSGPVTLLACNPKDSHVISSSNDCRIFISRIYPHMEESLSVMMSFDVTSCPSLLCVTEDRVGVACNDHAHSSYTIDMYCIQDRVSFSGEPENSHQATVTQLTSFPRLHLFASIAMDHTLRIWTSNNHPVRVLQLDGSPHAMAFSSPTAHITIALHKHLHSIEPSTYLPEQLLNQLVSMTTDNVEEQMPRKMTCELSTLTSEDQERLQVVDDTIKQDSYKGALSVGEMSELEETARKKAVGISLLIERDNEIRGIRNGIIQATKKRVGLRAGDRERVWQDVLALLHPCPRNTPLTIPVEDDFDPDTYGQSRPVVEPYSPYKKGQRLSFFPPLATFEPPYPIAPDGLLPNSAILQLLRKSEADRAMADNWLPPVLSDQQRNLMAEMEDKEEEIDDDDSDVRSQLLAALDGDYTSPSASLSPTPPTSPPPEPARRKIVPLKLEKLIAPPPPPKPITPPPRTLTPPAPKSPTPPPPPPTPLPEYIAQFIGRSWFDKLYPNANSSTFPRPWSVTRFIMSLLSHLSKFSVDSYTKADICQAIHCLLRSHNPSNTEDMHKIVLDQLTTPPPPSLLTPSHRPLITAALALLYHINTISPAVVIVGMVMAVEEGMGGEKGDKGEVKREFVGWLERNGIEDRHGYFTRHLTTMVHTHQVGSELWSGVEQWLEMWAQQQQQMTSGHKPTHHRPSQPHSKTNSTVRGRKVKQKAAMKRVSILNVIDVINYFIRVEHENEMARRRVVTPPPALPPEPEEELPHNTVLTLPKITRSRRVARLGETHCSCCHPERETTLALFHRLPPVQQHTSHPSNIWTGFSRTLSLAMKPQNINPFLTDEECKKEEQEAQQTPPTMTSLMKYFIPEQSVVSNYHH